MARRRSSPDPLTQANELRWLVACGACSRPLRRTVLQPKTDLRSALEAERQRMIADGWTADEVKRWAFCFASKGNDRLCISIEHVEPGTPHFWSRPIPVCPARLTPSGAASPDIPAVPPRRIQPMSLVITSFTVSTYTT